MGETESSTTNGPTSSSSTSPSGSGSAEENTSKDPNLVNYSDSSNDNDGHENDKDAPMFDMEVDEDGAPKIEQELSARNNFTENVSSSSGNNKRPAVSETETGENDIGVEAKKAKLEEQKTSTTDA